MARYHMVSQDSYVAIAGRSTLHPMTAEATGLSGWLEADVTDGVFVSDAIAGHVEIPVDRLASGNPLVDRETRRRIDAGRFPMITGDVASVVDVADNVATITGVIGFRGEQVEVEGELIAREDDGAVVLVGESVFDIRWWGLQPPRLLALKVYPEIKVDVVLTFRPD